jgi:porin
MRQQQSMAVFASLLCISFWTGSCARAEDADESETPKDFGGDLLTREKLLGNWWGYRPVLADKGVTIDSSLTQFYQGVASGGLRQEFRYGDHFDAVANLDGGKLGVLKGLSLHIRFEANFGSTVNDDTGALLPAALAPSLPVLNGGAALTDFLFTQELSDTFSVFVGKMSTLDEDENPFASGRGLTQFMNTAFVYNPITEQGMPYSTLGAGFTITKNKNPLLTLTVLDPQEKATRSVFDQPFARGVLFNGEVRVPVEVLGLPGHQVIGGDWNSQTFVSVNQDPRFVLPSGDIPIAPRAGTWNLYYSFDQHLVADPKHPEKGWGFFGRMGLSDGDPNPIKYFLSGGVGGASPIPGRERDSFGIGYAYSGASSQLGPIISRLIGDGQALEAFYNLSCTPWFHMTADVQVIRGGFEHADTALVVGLRGKIDF